MAQRRRQQRNSPNRPCYCSALRIQIVIIISVISLWKQHINGFAVVPSISSSSSSSKRHQRKQEQQEYVNDNNAAPLSISSKTFSFARFAVADDNYSNDDDDDDDDDDDGEYIDTDSLGDWRNFRRSLSTDDDDNLIDNVDYRDESSKKKNEEALKKQDKELAKEYASGAWAHVTSTVRYKYYLSCLSFKGSIVPICTTH